MIPNRIEAVRIFIPVPPTNPLIKGTISRKAKKPYTMDGIAAIMFTAGLKNLYNFGGQNFAIKIEVKTPVGTPMRIAPKVITNDPIIIGKMPYSGFAFDGVHLVPNRKSEMP